MSTRDTTDAAAADYTNVEALLYVYWMLTKPIQNPITPEQSEHRGAAIAELERKLGLLAIGTQVHMCGLTSVRGKKLNGRRGEVLGLDPANHHLIAVCLFPKKSGGERVTKSFHRRHLAP